MRRQRRRRSIKKRQARLLLVLTVTLTALFIIAGKNFGNMLEGIAVGNADVALAGFAEGITGDDGNSLGFEEPFAEFLRGEAG